MSLSTLHAYGYSMIGRESQSVAPCCGALLKSAIVVFKNAGQVVGRGICKSQVEELQRRVPPWYPTRANRFGEFQSWKPAETRKKKSHSTQFSSSLPSFAPNPAPVRIGTWLHSPTVGSCPSKRLSTGYCTVPTEALLIRPPPDRFSPLCPPVPELYLCTKVAPQR